MARSGKTWAIGVVAAMGLMALGVGEARADDATVTVGDPRQFSEPPPDPAVDRSRASDDLIAKDPELRRSAFRLALGPAGITTGRGFGLGVGVGAELGTGSVGGRLSAAWLRGEGTNGDGTSTPTGDSIGHYSGEITLDLHKRGPVHPIVGMGVGVVHVSRPDHASGLAGVGTGRLALEYALGLEDADVRLGVNVTGGIVGPVASEVKDLRGYALTGLHLAIGL